MGTTLTAKQAKERELELIRAAEEADQEEEVVNLSFEQVWDEFRARKFAYRKAHRRNPTAVMIGQVEMGVFQHNMGRLRNKNLVKQRGRRLWIMNMMVIATEAESMIMPMHGDLDQLDASPWMKFLKED